MRIAIDDSAAAVAPDVHAWLLRYAATELAREAAVEQVRVRFLPDREGYGCVVAVGLAGGSLVAERGRSCSLIVAAVRAIRLAARRVREAPARLRARGTG